MNRVIAALIAILRLVPIGLRRCFLRRMGRVYAALPLREVKIAHAQLKIFLKAENPATLVPQVFASVFETVAEAFGLDESDAIITCPDTELLQLLQNRDSAVVALSTHTGNWERMAHFFVKQGVPFTVVSREARNPILQPFLSTLRESGGFRTIWREDRSGLRALIDELKSNAHITALIDQDTTVKGICVPFFGRPAHTPVALVEIGIRYSAQFLFIYNYRVSTGHYVVRIQRLSGDTPEEILTSYSQQLEAAIRQHPEQWVWFHKRWRTGVDGHRMGTKEYLAFLDAELRA